MKKIIFLLVLLSTTAIFSQVVDEGETAICLTSPNSTHLTELDAIRGLDHSNDIFHLKIYVHVLRKQAEPKLGQNVEDVSRQLKYLYDTFDPLDINFVWNGEIDYIENDTYYGNVGGNTSNIFNTNSHTDGIDIYFFDVEQGNSAGGFGLADDIGGSALLVGGAYRGHKDGGERTPLAWRNIISHEMGHILYLWHTHHGTFDEGGGGCPEFVNGSNATICGDFIADTPADPGIFFTNFNSCDILEDPNNNIPDEDENGDTYVPDTSNLMSYTYPTCMVGFTGNQKSRMKNAIWYLPVLNSTLLTNWSYIRNNEYDCYICDLPKSFTFYSSYNANYISIVLGNSTNIDVTITQIDNISSAVTVTNLNPNDDEGSSGYFIIGHINGIDIVNQPIWVGLPQAVPDNIVNGPLEVTSGQFKYYKIDDGFLRLDGIDTYDWDFPEPNEPYTFFGGPPPNNPTIWEYSYFSKYVPKSGNSVGNDTGIVAVRGENPCGFGSNGLENKLCVVNLDDNDGEPDCSFTPGVIYYYPNPAGSLLQIDLSLQAYKVFDIVIYDENQTVKYSDQSTNVIKTVDTFNLTNGTYYLHIYDGSDLILSAILIINH